LSAKRERILILQIAVTYCSLGEAWKRALSLTAIFEFANIMGKATAGVMKDVVMLGGHQEVAFDFVANDPGMTLFHCHQQLHMDCGFMTLFDCG
jgi:hypothetical protein